MNPNNLDSFFGLSTLNEAILLYTHLKQPLFTARDMGIPPRTIINWEKYGLISMKREIKDEWRRFNLTEYIWLHLVQELRNVGTPLNIIAKVSQFALAPISLKWIYELD